MFLKRIGTIRRGIFGLQPVKRIYRRILLWSRDHRAVVILLVLVLFAGSAGAFFVFGKDAEVFPETEPRRA